MRFCKHLVAKGDNTNHLQQGQARKTPREARNHRSMLGPLAFPGPLVARPLPCPGRPCPPPQPAPVLPAPAASHPAPPARPILPSCALGSPPWLPDPRHRLQTCPASPRRGPYSRLRGWRGGLSRLPWAEGPSWMWRRAMTCAPTRNQGRVPGARRLRAFRSGMWRPARPATPLQVQTASGAGGVKRGHPANRRAGLSVHWLPALAQPSSHRRTRWRASCRCDRPA